MDSRLIKLYFYEVSFEKHFEGQATTLRELVSIADEVEYDLVGSYEQNDIQEHLSYPDALFVAGNSYRRNDMGAVDGVGNDQD